MGCGPSAITETPDDLLYFNLTYHWVDTIRLVHGKTRPMALIKKAITANWKPGIGSSFLNKGAVDHELKGRPFVKGASTTDMVMCKKMSTCILEYLLADGWCLTISADMSRLIDQTTLFFRHYPDRAMGKNKPAQVTCFSFHGTEDIHLIKTTPELVAAVKGALNEKYPKGITSVKQLEDDCYNIRVNSHPWTSEGQEGMDARRMFLEVIRQFQSMGWYFYGTANIHGTADCVYFVKHPGGNGWIEDGEYAIMSLNDNDKIRLIDLPNEVVRELKQVIVATRGQDAIQREVEHFGTYEFKLKGNPWAAEAQDVVISRFTVTKVLEMLHAQGWEVYNAVDMSRKMNDKAVFLLRQCDKRQRRYFCMAPAEIDKIRLINAPNLAIDIVRNCLEEYYMLGIAREDEDYYGAHEFKLKGQPWYGRQGNDELFGRSFMTFLINEMDKNGWQPIVATDVSAKHVRSENGPDYVLDTHSWWFGAKM